MMTNSPFTLSIEPTNDPAFQHGYHLGTDERVARGIAVERFIGRNAYGLATRTVALMRGGRIIDVFDGVWSSAFGMEG
jgi:hypothetical protein